MLNELRRAKIELRSQLSGDVDADCILSLGGRLDDWLEEVQRVLGSGGGRWFRGPLDFYPRPPYWNVSREGARVLQRSADEVAIAVGAALRPPLPGWLDAGAAEMIASFGTRTLLHHNDTDARPISHPRLPPEPWMHEAGIIYHYPMTLKSQAQRLDRLVLMERGSLAIPQTTVIDQAAGAPDDAAALPVRLRGPTEPPLVLGVPMQRPLTSKQHAIVAALVRAGDDGLDKKGLERICGGALKILRKLVNETSLGKVIRPAGRAGGRYRIVRPSGG